MIRRLSNHAISTLKEKYLETFGIEITDDEANVKGLELLQYMKVIYKPIPIEDYKILTNQLDKK